MRCLGGCFPNFWLGGNTLILGVLLRISFWGSDKKSGASTSPVPARKSEDSLAQVDFDMHHDAPVCPEP